MFKDVVRSWRRKIREAKAQLELKLATSMKDYKKCFYKCINSKRRGKKNLHSLLDLMGNIANKDKEKTKLLNTFFTSAKELLNHLDAHKAMGPDGIHPRVMREMADDQSWLIVQVPNVWKLDNVMLIHKRGRRRIQKTAGLSA